MNLWRDDGDDDDNDDDAQTSVGGGNDGDRALSLTQEAEDRRAELRVAPQEFGRLRRGGGPPAVSVRQGEDTETATSKRRLCGQRTADDDCHRKAASVDGGGQRKQPTRAEGQDDNDDTIVGSNGFVRRLKQQSTNEGGTRGEMVMKCVKKEEERTTIEGRGHDDITIK